LTVNGQTQIQPIAVELDPRVKITPEVQQIFTLTARMESGARNAGSAYKDARELVDKLKSRPQSAANDALIKEVEDIAPAEAAGDGAGGGGRGGRGGRGGGRGGGAAAAAGPPNLTNMGAVMLAAAQAMQGSEMAPTAAQLQACSQEEEAYSALMAKWAALKAKVGGSVGAAGRGGKL
jgi:hypothetical protein